MSIPEETIEAIRARTDIVAVVSRHVTLKKRGRSFLGLCPFHGEKTPSFNVDQERQRWHCFGCGDGGDVFRFLMRIDGLTFPESVERLAAQAGIPITRDAASEERRSVRQQLFAANKAAASFYWQQLQRSPAAQEYVRRRGLSGESAQSLGLGYAPEEWALLSDTLLRRGFAADLLAQAGLSRQRDNGGSYDYFRGRLIFPIRDVEGRILGFGGRAMGDVQPKYLNSPETPVFDKGHTLYGLDRAWRAIADSGVAIIVEGYMDAAMAAQAGVANVVATLGTALGQSHLDLLRRYASRVVLAYDGDKAGVAAAERSLALFESAGIEGQILILPDGRDPDEFIRERGVEAFQEAAAKALPLIEFQLQRLTERADRATPEGRAALVQSVAPVLAGIRSAIKREEYVRRFAEEWCAGQMHRVHQVEEAIRREVGRSGGFRPTASQWQFANTVGARAGEGVRPPAAAEPVIAPRIVHAEQFVLQGLLHRVVSLNVVFAEIAPEDFQVAAHRRLAEILQRQQHTLAALDLDMLTAGEEDGVVDGVISQLLLEQDRLVVNAKMVQDSLWAIKESKYRARINQLQDALMQPENVSDEEYSRMAEEKRQLVKKLSDFNANRAG